MQQLTFQLDDWLCHLFMLLLLSAKGLNVMLNKNTLGAKICEANQKQQLNGYACDQNVWYLAKAKNCAEYKISNLLYW